ncbi:MAG: UTP--glucose-1-phosphate uridylyltransferase GalU [Thermoplasmatota archaeon]
MSRNAKAKPMRAVIPAGGFGTRMLPATKSMPKEMMPVLDRPAIQYVLDEAVQSGIDEVVIITGRHKKAIEDHFDSSPDLEGFLRDSGRGKSLSLIQNAAGGARLFYIRQDWPKGLGHAVLQAAPLVEGRPFAVLLGDDIILGARPAIAQLRDVHERTRASVFCVQRVPSNEVSRYGIVETEPMGRGLHRVLDIIEKPSAEEAPSNLAAIGRYVFTPGLMPLLAKTKPGVGGEIQLTDAMRALAKKEELYCQEFRGRRFDVGSLEGWLEATLHLAAKRKDLHHVLDAFLAEHRKDHSLGAWND